MNAGTVTRGGTIVSHGTSAYGRSRHGADCDCVRCAGFQPGHALSLKHGAYATLRLEPRAVELADEIRLVAPLLAPADEPMLRTLAFTLARLERASAALEDAEPGELAKLTEDARRWAALALKYAESFGMTPGARARLGLAVAQTERTLTLTGLAALADSEAAA